LKYTEKLKEEVSDLKQSQGQEELLAQQLHQTCLSKKD